MFVLMVRKEHGVCVSSRVLYIYVLSIFTFFEINVYIYHLVSTCVVK